MLLCMSYRRRRVRGDRGVNRVLTTLPPPHYTIYAYAQQLLYFIFIY